MTTVTITWLLINSSTIVILDMDSAPHVEYSDVVPVWCICGHKQLSDGWTSNNKQLDEFIKKSQLQTTSPNDAYLEWIPFDCIEEEYGCKYLYGLPTYEDVKLIPLDNRRDT